MPTVPTTTLTHAIRVRNITGADRELWIEPLGDRVVLAPEILYELTVTDALEEIDFSGDGFTVHGWVIRVAAVGSDGKTETVWECPSERDA